VEDEQRRKREELYAETRKDLLARQLSNAEQFDKAVLTLSSGGLGLSLAFIKDFVPIDKAQVITFLVVSWILFGFAIISTVISFLVSQRAINIQLHYAEQYYLKADGGYLTKKNVPAKITDVLNYASGILFVAAVGCTITFVMFNLGGAKMAEGKSKRVQINEGAPIPTLQSVPGSGIEKKGAPIPSMPAVPGEQPKPGGGQSGGGQSGQSGSGKK
jgi:hypothetical protein